MRVCTYVHAYMHLCVFVSLCMCECLGGECLSVCVSVYGVSVHVCSVHVRVFKRRVCMCECLGGESV